MVRDALCVRELRMCWLVAIVDTNNGLRRICLCSSFIAASLIEVFRVILEVLLALEV